ncbi:MAG: glycosyl transferase family 2 [Ignavibacteria bacterium]|nr:MAG: glycosyl transferase family 2 [Ignavibacteria bacterium]KAF0161219.1 MAG: glycosyl transferase family 2 [Ignavibacteria bacterium]
MIELSIIIVNYNVKEFVLNLLGSISKASSNLSTEIFVVDNASDDGSVEAIREKFPSINLIDNKKNVGFGAANNQALELAKGKFFLLINPDTIVREDTFSKMINFFETNPICGIAGCKVLNPDGSLQLACRRGFPGPWTSFTKVMGLSSLFPKSKLFARYNLTYLDENQTYEVDAVSGAFMMMRREVYDKIGGFDPQFFMYGEDLDLCYRTQQAGFKVFYVHETEIIHYKGESTKRSSIDETKVFYDAMHLFVKKHFSTSFIVESILQMAIVFRKLIAFANVYKLSIISVIADLTVYSSVVIVAEKLYLESRTNGFPYYAKPWVYFVPSLIQVFISLLSGAYKKNTISVSRMFISLVYGLLFLSAATYFFKQFGFSRAVVLITYSVCFVVFLLWRILLKVIFKFGLKADTKKARTLIVGSENRIEDVAAKLKSSVVKLYHIIGFIGLSRKSIGEKLGAYQFLGSTENLKKIIEEEKIDKVIFSSDDIHFNQMFSVVSACQGLNVEFLVVGKELDYLVGKSSMTMLDDMSLLKVNYNVSALSNRITKRFFDLSAGILALFLLYPFIYLFQKLTSKKGAFTQFILGLPQVCVGNKSFVGAQTSSYHDSLYVGKVGLTGLWFIEGFTQPDFDEIKKLEIFYARNQNFWLDIEILGKTFSKMFFRTE